MIIRSFLLCLCLCVGTSFVIAESELESTATLQDGTAAAELQSYLDEMTSFESNFLQQRYSANRALLDTTSGRFVLKRPLHFIWQTFSPFEQKIVSDGESMWTIDDDLEQVIINPLDESVSNAPIFLLVNKQSSITSMFNVEKQMLDTNTTFVLEPVDQSGHFERVRLGFDGKTLAIMELYDSLGQLTRISMTNSRKNPIISMDEFVTEIPDDYDVIDSRLIENTK